MQFLLWNNLPDSVVHSESLVTFKQSLQLYHCFCYCRCMLALAGCHFMHPLLLGINFQKKTKNKKTTVQCWYNKVLHFICLIAHYSPQNGLHYTPTMLGLHC